MDYYAKIYARIGELMQGFLPDAAAFLVSGLPSRVFYSEASIEKGTHLLPSRANQALSLFLRTYAGEQTVAPSIRLYTNIPSGKGLSSSSTDILSVLSVANDYLKTGCSAEELYRIAAAIEPTDPCLSDEMLVFRQHTGIVERCFSLPPMTVLYFDAEPGRKIDTLEVDRSYTEGTGKFFDWLLRRFLHAAKNKDYEAIFDCITYSAEYNQTVIALPGMSGYLELARSTNSGLMVAHSGTIIGLLTIPEKTAALRLKLQAITNQHIYTEHYLPRQ